MDIQDDGLPPQMAIERELERCARFGVRPGLDSMRSICMALGDPQERLRTIHVAGTNGKGAVCALVDSALRAAGFWVGRYTSPHLVSINERFFLDGKAVSCETLDSAFRKVRAALGDLSLTYFELLTATAFELYGNAGVDYLVLEAGLGGRLDATNIVRRPEICVITRIGLDHCEWLGSTVRDIAAEKGGIIKRGIPVVLGSMPDEARAVLEGMAADRGARCIYAPEAIDEASVPPGLALGGAFNRENAITAMAVLDALRVRTDAVARGFAAVEWPGRYQRVVKDGKVFLVDGAHNPPAMGALVASLQAERNADSGCGVGRVAICGFCGDKDVAANLRLLREVADEGFAVPIRNPRSLPPERTAELMREAGFGSVRICRTVGEALAAAPSGTVVCGSLFLAGEALELLCGDVRPAARFTPNETFVKADGTHGSEEGV